MYATRKTSHGATVTQHVGRGQRVEFSGAHADQPWVGQSGEHLSTSASRPALRAGRHRLGSGGGLGAQGVVPGAVRGVSPQRQGGEAFLADGC